LSLRSIEELFFERGVSVSYETIRRWADKFGAGFANRVKAARRKSGLTWHLDEMFVTPCAEPYLLLEQSISTASSLISHCRNVATRRGQAEFQARSCCLC
jgi:transposase-like protein